MKSSIDWFTHKGNFSFHHKVMLDYVSRLSVYLESYKNGEIDAGTCLKICRKTLSEIDDLEFPFFAVRNFRELFSFIVHHLPTVPSHHRVLTLQSKEQYEIKKRDNIMHKYREKRQHKRIEKPYMARFRIKQYKGLEISSTEWDVVALKDLSAGGALFYYSKYLGLGSLLDLKTDVSIATPTVKCAGKVTRIEQSQPHTIYRIATEFTEISEQEKETINTTIEKALERKKTKYFRREMP